jgi:hypothetical protein
MVARFFRLKSPWSLTTTTFRALVETSFADALERGRITATEKAAVEGVLGHSAKTAANFYVKKKRDKVNPHSYFICRCYI